MRAARTVGEEGSLARFLHLSCSERPRRAASIDGRGRGDPAKRVEEKMLTEMIGNTRAMKAVRVGLIVTSWAFLVLGFALTHNV